MLIRLTRLITSAHASTSHSLVRRDAAIYNCSFACVYYQKRQSYCRIQSRRALILLFILLISLYQVFESNLLQKEKKMLKFKQKTNPSQINDSKYGHRTSICTRKVEALVPPTAGAELWHDQLSNTSQFTKCHLSGHW